MENAKKQSSQGKGPKITGKDLLVIGETQADDRGRSSKLRVVQWTANGRKGKPKLEKRGFYKSEKGGLLTGDVLPLTFEDVRALAPALPKVLEVMQTA